MGISKSAVPKQSLRVDEQSSDGIGASKVTESISSRTKPPAPSRSPGQQRVGIVARLLYAVVMPSRVQASGETPAALTNFPEVIGARELRGAFTNL